MCPLSVFNSYWLAAALTNPKQSLGSTRQSTDKINSNIHNSTESHVNVSVLSRFNRAKKKLLFSVGAEAVEQRRWIAWQWKRRKEKLGVKRGWWITHDGPVTYIFCLCLTCQGVSKSKPNSWECTKKSTNPLFLTITNAKAGNQFFKKHWCVMFPTKVVG